MTTEILSIILNVLKEVGGEKLGRTGLQKIIYFLNEKLDLSINYSAYLYGPYSEEITDGINLLTSFGFVDMKVEKISNDVEYVSYKYSINNEGERYLSTKKYIGSVEIKEIYENYKVYLAENLKYLSYASKYHYLEKNFPYEGKKVTDRADIISRYKWEIPDDATDGIISFLDSIGVKI